MFLDKNALLPHFPTFFPLVLFVFYYTLVALVFGLVFGLHFYFSFSSFFIFLFFFLVLLVVFACEKCLIDKKLYLVEIFITKIAFRDVFSTK